MTAFPQPFPAHHAFPDLGARVMVPPTCSNLKAPWVNLHAGGLFSINPITTRATPDELRAMADEIDAAWAILDRRAELAGQPEDTTQFSALDNLAAGLPAFAPRVED